MSIIPLTLACILAVQGHYGFPRETMFALLVKEGGKEGQCSTNTNKTTDCGPYQINSIHAGRFARQWGVDREAAYVRLRDDGCQNAWAAGELLNEHWQRTGDIWTAIGHYHSRTEHLAMRYRADTYDKVVKLYEPVAPASRSRRKADQ